MAMNETFNVSFFILGLIINNLLFIQMRLGDELKDFETDKIINPTRPLPRGLLTTREILQFLVGFLILLILSGLIIASVKSPLGGASLILATAFSWLMFKEFYMAHELDKSPMLYAITHQVIVFPIFAWLGLTFDETLIHNQMFQGWLIANFGASFTFEFCRKLDPKAHKLAKTYAHHYGKNLTVLLCTCFMIISAFGAYWGGFTLYSLPILFILLTGLMVWRQNPEKYKLPAGLSALSSSAILFAPALIWLFKSWSA